MEFNTGIIQKKTLYIKLQINGEIKLTILVGKFIKYL